jgi:hypothetical protein
MICFLYSADQPIYRWKPDEATIRSGVNLEVEEILTFMCGPGDTPASKEARRIVIEGFSDEQYKLYYGHDRPRSEEGVNPDPQRGNGREKNNK